MTKIEAILFDMDGVLIDAKEWHYEALNDALGLFGYNISRFDHLVTFDGLPTSKKLQMLSKMVELPTELHSCISAIKQKLTIENSYKNCKAYYPHQYALSRLQREGYRMCVCSNSIAKTIETLLNLSDIDKYFEFFLSADDVVLPKPAPEIYLNAMKRLGINPSKCLIIEDNDHGIAAATQSGANVMRVDDVKDVNYNAIKQHLEGLVVQ